MAQQLNDKDWLEKVSIAYRAYPYPSYQVSEFIAWMYKQYGIVQPKEKNEDRI